MRARRGSHAIESTRAGGGIRYPGQVVRLLVGIALCAGCYNPAIAPGTACATDCPGDLVCIDHVCREAGYVPGVDAAVTDAFVPIDTLDGPPGDGDADGVADSADNCPATANADQHDEDGDAIGDVCDPCPHLAGTAADGDGDGVGDACDPQPGVAKQRIRFFDPFTSNRPEWQHETGTRVGETLRIQAASGGSESRLAIPNGEARIAMAGTIAAVSASTPRQVSLTFGGNQTTTIYHYGEFYDPGGTSIEITKRNSSAYTSLDATDVGGPIPTGAWAMRIDESVAAQQITMAAVLGGTTYPTLAGNTSTSPTLVPSDYTTIFVMNLDLRLDYFIVIETLP